MKEYIKKVVEVNDLTETEAFEAMQKIMNGESTNAQTAGFITAMRMKGETIDEITGFACVMREKASRIKPNDPNSLDTCGTGGDASGTFNISTAAAIIASAAGITVSKHGNRSVSSKSGSADVLEKLGVKIDLEPDKVKKCLDKVKIGFMFAPMFHASMKYAAPPRRELGIRTVFNILGPLTNPAQARYQLLGVFSPKLLPVMATVLSRLGVEKAMVVHGRDGLDEITLTDKTLVCEVDREKLTEYEINPEDYGLKMCKINEIQSKDADDSAEIIKDILSGKEKGAKRDIVILNAGAAIYVSSKVKTIKEGIELAKEIIDSGKALKKLESWKAESWKV